MADMESLEKLSNAELRLKCIEFGLPNVPITDSSRKLLLKKLLNTINSSSSKDNISKSSNRRETMHATKIAATENVAEAAPKNRRTIAAPVQQNKDVDVPTSIPVSTRRRSVQKEIVDPKPVRSSQRPSQLDTIIIEDDDDMALLDAAEIAERESVASSIAVETISSRRKSRSVSVPKAPEVQANVTKKRPMTPLVEEKQQDREKIPQAINKQINIPSSQSLQKTFTSELVFTSNMSSTNNNTKLSTQQPQQQQQQHQQPSFTASIDKNFIQPFSKAPMEVTNRYGGQNTTPSVYSTPSMRYSIGGSGFGGNLSAAYRTKYTPSSILNEQSDTDGNNEDNCASPFLSNFARNLERSRSVGRTTGSSMGRYARKPSGSNFESIHGRRRPSQNDLTFGQLFNALSRKYHLKAIAAGLFVLCASIFIYVALKS